MANRFLAPSDGIGIRKPTDKALMKGNIVNPPRYQDRAMGGLNGAGARGIVRNEAKIEPPAETIRRVPQAKG